MTSFPTAYTPLETLLLFQALRSEGVNSHSVFNRISDQLKSIYLIQKDPSFHSGRLSPDALRELYRGLLEGEAKRDVERQFEQENLLQNGDVSPGSRKRKAPGPSLPTVHEASQHTHLIPQLVTKLYSRYREHVVREIKEHERRYDALTRDIEEIETGGWDERLQRQRTASATQSPRPSSSAHTQPVLDAQPSKASNASPSLPQKMIESNAKAPSKPYTVNKIDALINHGPEIQNGSSNHRRNSSNTTLPPLSEMAPQSPQFGIPATIPTPIKTQAQAHSPPNNHHSPYASHHGHPIPGSMASPQVQNSLSRPSSSPRPILPPPPGMTFPPPSPVQHTGSPGLHGSVMPPQQHYAPQPPPHRLSTGPSPANERPHHGYPTYQQPHPSPGYYQQQPYLDRRSSHPPPQEHYGPPGYGAQAGGYQVQPSPVDLQAPLTGRASQPQLYQQQGAMPRESPTHVQRPPYPQYSPEAPATAPKSVRPAHPRIVTDIIAALATPPRSQRRPVWKIERRPQPIKVGTPVPRPDPEPLSPVLKRNEPAARFTRSTRNRAASVAEQSTELELPRTTRGRGRTKRDRSPHSAVSSTADESARMTRSHSVSTAAGALPTSDDRPGSRGNVKVEPSTPAGFVEKPELLHEVPSGGRMTRKRRGTLQSQPQPPPKRKRQHSPAGPSERESENLGTPPPRSNTVTATRNFHKLSATIMNDINSHKHASYFSNPVRDKDAPGYSEIIKQAQNLKSIRTSITAGTKAVNAAASTLDSPSATATGADGSTSVELERTVDLVPPKAIVNASQLEKEIVRMFANAVMFNPGEDGMVSDTREMFEDIDAKIQEWRGAEKDSGENEIVEEEVKGKRRKL